MIREGKHFRNGLTAVMFRLANHQNSARCDVSDTIAQADSSIRKNHVETCSEHGLESTGGYIIQVT